jgi:pimeloyl-ACP methyl ester carboxylesterase
MVGVWLVFSAGCSSWDSSLGAKPQPLTWESASEGADTLAFPQKLDQGYTVVLPGVMGSAPLDHGIVKGLVDAGVPTAVELYDWTASPIRIVYNLRALSRNRNEARKIAERIVAYQDRYPGRPVYLVGYSGGAAVAVLALEALPTDRKITKAVLLAPTLAQDYDLQLALSRTEQGVHSFHSAIDVPVMVVLATALGTTEGKHTFTAGAFGFQRPKGPEDSQRRPDYSRLTQHAYELKMLESGHAGGHFGWANRGWVAQWVAPMLGQAPGSEARAPLRPQSSPDHVAVHQDGNWRGETTSAAWNAPPQDVR